MCFLECVLRAFQYIFKRALEERYCKISVENAAECEVFKNGRDFTDSAARVCNFVLFYILLHHVALTTEEQMAVTFLVHK